MATIAYYAFYFYGGDFVMKRIYQGALFIGGFIFLGLIAILLTNIDPIDNREGATPMAEEQQLEVQAMDEILAEDLSKTTSLFLSQLSFQLKRWAHADLSTPEFKQAFAKEVEEHEHFHSFALMKGEEITESYPEDSITAEKIKEIKHKANSLSFSDPYKRDEKYYVLMSEKVDGDTTVFGEVDLSFVKKYVKNMGSIADANGNFFVSGDDPQVKWTTMKEVPDNVAAQTVPELGWKIVVQSEEQTENTEHYVEGQALVKINGTEAIQWIDDQQDLTLIENHDPYFLIQSKSLSTDELIQALGNDPRIELAEPNYIFTKQSTTATKLPNDEFFAPYQWNLDQIAVNEGWELTEGSESIVIAVLDTGVDPNHQDLKGKVLPGYNAFDHSSNSSDGHGHGTHVAGIAAAVTNNLTGIAGVAWENKILPIKVLNDNGEGSSFEVASGIRWAVDNGASVLNMSLGDYHHSQVLQDAIQYAHQQGAVLIAASGNDNVQDPMYPAHYDEVLTVGAVNDNRERAIFSNYGKHIDVAAPGEHIPSTFPDNNYVIMSGTSMAAPHVAGLAGLIRSLNPHLSNVDVYEIIRNSTVDLGAEGPDPYYGHGEIHVGKALKLATGQ